MERSSNQLHRGPASFGVDRLTWTRDGYLMEYKTMRLHSKGENLA